jgi:anti-sigma regulatory factor (Ser/Thr protein kinase)
VVVSVGPGSRDGGGYRHEALLYAGLDEFVDACVGIIRDGAEADEPTLVVVPGPKIEALRSALGPTPETVTFADMLQVGRNPARIISFWQSFVTDQAPSGRPLRGIGEPIGAELPAPVLAECQLHEALLNVAFEPASPLWLLCPYDVSSLGDDVIHEARRTHPHIAQAGLQATSPSYEEFDRAAPFDRPLPPPPPDAAWMDFDAGRLERVRAFVSDQARATRIDGGGVADLVVAVHELATNSVEHGGGGGVVRAWQTSDAIVVEVADRGNIAAPLAGRLRPSPDGDRGRGLWMANQLCDLVQIRSSAGAGTVVRVTLSGGAAQNVRGAVGVG